MSKQIQLAVVDDHPLVRDGIVHAISCAASLRVVAEGATAQDAVGIVRSHEPDLLLLDLNLPGHGLGAITEIAALRRRTRVVVLTASEAPEDVMAALRGGASGYLLKGIGGAQLVEILIRIHGSELYVSPELGARMLCDISRAGKGIPADKAPLLSERETEILVLIRRGLGNKEISFALQLSEKTVKHYLTNIFRKMGVHNRTQLAMRG